MCCACAQRTVNRVANQTHLPRCEPLPLQPARMDRAP